MTKFNAPAQALPVKGIFDRIGIDLVLGLPLTVDGYKGILVITEYLSKFPYAVPIRSKTADEIAEKLWAYISIFGPAKEIISDNGSEFINKVIDRLLAFSGIERRITSKYSPATNGLTERFNATLIKSLSKHAYENPQNWPEWLPFILLSYRTRVHSITGFTPFFFMLWT
jgi:transposase InsO family protein